ncbi:hypothetical protein [Chromobacterium violaceum]|uniref:hypothetical protein n=1 Tax=Chromobacterium violaceum TaxID=536 RepID=UPI00111C337D|nr:hypothetical protein [Chromobacterium violaceum]
MAYTPSLGRRLIKLANLDGLAALLLYWAESNSVGRAAETCEQALQIYQALLIVFPGFKHRGLEHEIFSLVRSIVFDKTIWPNGIFVTGSEIYARSAIALHTIVSKEDSGGYYSSQSKRARVILNFIDGLNGMDIKYAMHPLFEPCLAYGPPCKFDWDKCCKIKQLWKWGWHQLIKRLEADLQ